MRERRAESTYPFIVAGEGEERLAHPLGSSAGWVDRPLRAGLGSRGPPARSLGFLRGPRRQQVVRPRTGKARQWRRDGAGGGPEGEVCQVDEGARQRRSLPIERGRRERCLPARACRSSLRDRRLGGKHRDSSRGGHRRARERDGGPAHSRTRALNRGRRSGGGKEGGYTLARGCKADERSTRL